MASRPAPASAPSHKLLLPPLSCLRHPSDPQEAHPTHYSQTQQKDIYLRGQTLDLDYLAIRYKHQCWMGWQCTRRERGKKNLRFQQ